MTELSESIFKKMLIATWYIKHYTKQFIYFLRLNLVHLENWASNETQQVRILENTPGNQSILETQLDFMNLLDYKETLIP